MKTKKLLSVIAAASVAMTAFASLTITASAKDYNAKDLKNGMILYPGDTITITGGVEEDPVLYLDYDDSDDYFCFGEESFTLPNDYKWYKIVYYDYEEEYEDEDDPGFFWAEECDITFVTNVTSVSFDKQELTLVEGSTGNLITHVEPHWAENKNYTLSSSDPSVATVDAGGTVTAVAEGTATVTATSQDDNTIVGTCTVTVTKRPATATYAQVGEDYAPQFDTDRTASLWKVTVTPGTDAITSLSVKVNEKTPDAPLSDTTQFSGGSIVFGVVLNGVAADVQSFNALVNGEAVTTTAE